MKVAVGADHAGLPAKTQVVETLRLAGHEVLDLGTNSTESVDYPDYALAVSERVVSGEAAMGILCCGTGLGMSMTANKVPGIRAAACHDIYTAEMARRHNDANVLCIGARVLDDAAVDMVVSAFVDTPFDGGRHMARVEKINATDKLCP
jgi:ribose 5-phosphate isomerase B